MLDEPGGELAGATTYPRARRRRSSPRGRGRWWPFALSAMVTVAAFAAMAWLWRQSTSLGGMDIAEAAVPASGATYYLAHDRGGHVDHHVLYYGLDRQAADRLAAADVLFLGNSRLMFALDRQVLRRVFPPLDLRYYVLGFGHDEAYAFPLDLIERHDLRPSIVVANVDGFFTMTYSPWAEKVIEDGVFDAWKLRLESTSAHAVRRRLHQVVPHWPDLLAGGREFVIYRSALDGTWEVGTQFDLTGPLPVRRDPAQVRTDPTVLARARQFKAAIESRGARLIFCLVPSPDLSRAEARAIADAVGVPLVAPEPRNPRTMDGSHLTEESAERFAEDLLEQLMPFIAGD